MEGDNILEIYKHQKSRNLSKYDQIKDDVYVSRFEGLSFEEYIETRSLFCKAQHAKTCQDCCLQIKVAKHVKQEGYITLKSAFEMCSPGVSYTSSHAKRKLLQMPFAAVGIGSKNAGSYRIYLVEKQMCTNYAVFQALLNEVVGKTVGSRVSFVTKEEMKSLLTLAESEAEKEHLKYAVVKSAGMSADKAQKMFGFHNVNRRAVTVESAHEEACEIKDSIMNIARLKDSALLESFGLQDTLSDDDKSDSENDDDDELLQEQPKEHCNMFLGGKQVDDDNLSRRGDVSQQDKPPDIMEEMTSEDLLDI